ncbi:MAG: TIGR02757 family protein [Deltaproteobacteria bacterium]|nr:TIGR02757 family protein [Deltaproteobacteria bacterium]MBW2082133.1 TIGR02757 family protein [Deltaproteobacteria bacterium]RLB82179.1 MAG: TIGR02757 family protein [Deltaproteobacteria bacterium]HDM10049.1 TIGR02757 family protein [Desulfobacteraceae bacterium]
MKAIKAWLDAIYHKYNHPRWIHPDPLEFVHRYGNHLDQEVVGLIASSLAYGRVTLILSSVESILQPMGISPRDFVLATDEHLWSTLYRDFKHRFTTVDHLIGLLRGVKKALSRYGTLGECFSLHMDKANPSIIHALGGFVRDLRNGETCYNSLLPLPEKGSACKRLHLFLRWMIRRDSVDPGPWEGISPSVLVIPLDTHMYRICSTLGMTSRKSADQKCAMEITEYFRNICPEDPVKYDFCLSRLGIRQEDFVMPEDSILNP